MTNIHNKIELYKRRKLLRKNQTKAESVLWEYLRAKRFNNFKFKRQHSIDWYIADFYCAEKRLVIEIDGDSHFENKAIEYDITRTKFLNSLNTKVIRFTNEEIFSDIENVLKKIAKQLSTSPNPSLQRRGN